MRARSKPVWCASERRSRCSVAPSASRVRANRSPNSRWASRPASDPSLKRYTGCRPPLRCKAYVCEPRSSTMSGSANRSGMRNSVTRASASTGSDEIDDSPRAARARAAYAARREIASATRARAATRSCLRALRARGAPRRAARRPESRSARARTGPVRRGRDRGSPRASPRSPAPPAAAPPTPPSPAAHDRRRAPRRARRPRVGVPKAARRV